MKEFNCFSPHFEDNSYLKFVRGNFDNWCVERNEPGHKSIWPSDKDYFSDLLELGKIVGNENVFEDFRTLYTITVPNISPVRVEEYIKRSSVKYGEKSLLMKKTFCTLYMGMIAELNRDSRYAKNGKYAKVLGVYQVLIGGMSPKDAADFSKGDGKSELIREECEKLGLII